MRLGKLLAIISTFFSFSAIAGGIESPPFSFSGGYFGAGIGPHLLFFKQATLLTVDHEIPVPNFFLVTESRANMGKPGFIGNIHLGYGRSFNNIGYIAGEVFGEWYTNSAHFQQISQVVGVPATYILPEAFKINARHAFGLVLRTGIQPSWRTLIYIVLGVSWAKLVNSTDGGVAIPVSTQPNLVHSLQLFPNSNSRNKAGFRAGLGTAILLARHLVFRLEYYYTGYGRFNTLSPAFETDSVQDPFLLVFAHNAKVSTHAVTFNLDFLF